MIRIKQKKVLKCFRFFPLHQNAGSHKLAQEKMTQPLTPQYLLEGDEALHLEPGILIQELYSFPFFFSFLFSVSQIALFCSNNY